MNADNTKNFAERIAETAPVKAYERARKSISVVGKALAKRNSAPKILPSTFDYIRAPLSDHFTAGYGKACILPSGIPQKKYYIAGYRVNNPAKGVLDPPYACALWLNDNSGRGGMLFVSIDNVGMLGSDVNALRLYLSDFARTTDCRSINISSTHNHAGIDTLGLWGPIPVSGRNPSYMKFLFEKVKQAAISAYKDRKNGELYYGSVRVPDIQRDTREPVVYSDVLTRFRFVPSGGGREIYIINFASHSESLQGSNSFVSADFPGHIRNEIKRKAGAETIYFVGAIGGQISTRPDGGDETKKQNGDFSEVCENTGKYIASYALSVTDEKKLSPRINFIRQEFYLDVENPIYLMAKAANIIKADICRRAKSPTGMSLKTEMTYVEIGGVKILFLPGELFPELAYGGYLTAESSATGLSPGINPEPLVKTAEDDRLIVTGLTNDEVGYIIPPNDFFLSEDMPYIENAIDRLGRRHYEETNSVGPNAAEQIASVFADVINNVKSTKIRFK
ncbi:MAG: hypothetical protein K6F09_04980 [Clostridiales bacterium]|nr:hypothetical protein [Clostridiales bacterium]